MEGIVNRHRTLLGAIAVTVALSIGGVSAHHSQSAYEPTKTITIEGTMQAISWANPHSLFFVNAKQVGDPNSKETRWSVEGPAPRALEAAGWMRTDVKIGEKITMTGRPRRDGKPVLLVTSLVEANGKKISFRPDGPDAQYPQ